MPPKRANNVDGLVGGLIRTHRMRLGWSQTRLGAELGITFQQVQKYEKGVNRVGAGRLFEMARAFGVPVQLLFPEMNEGSSGNDDRAVETERLAQMLKTADGWRLCRAFLQIENADFRRKIIALIEEMAAR